MEPRFNSEHSHLTTKLCNFQVHASCLVSSAVQNPLQKFSQMLTKHIHLFLFMSFKTPSSKFCLFRHLLCQESSTLIKILLLSSHYIKGSVLTLMGIGKCLGFGVWCQRDYSVFIRWSLCPKPESRMLESPGWGLEYLWPIIVLCNINSTQM